MKRAMVQIQFDASDDEREIIAAHAYKDRQIICTVLIEATLDERYRIHVAGEETAFDLMVPSQYTAVNLADAYLAGFMSGYDQGDEHGKADPRHDWPDADRRANDRCLRCGGRITAPQGQHRNRAHDQGTGQSQHQD